MFSTLLLFSLALLGASARSTSDDLYASIDGLYSFGFNGSWSSLGWQTALAYSAYIDVLDWRGTFSGKNDRLDSSLARTRLALPNNLIQNNWNDDAGWWGVMSLRYYETFGDTSQDGSSSYDDNANRVGGDFDHMPIYATDAHNCQRQCLSFSGCQSWAFSKCGRNDCYLKRSVPGSSNDQCSVSGTVTHPSTGADYLGTAKNIWAVLNPRWIISSGCGAGGMIERQDQKYVSAIASSLNTVLSAKLFFHTREQKYLDAAIASNEYVEGSLRTSDCISDGVDPSKNCQVSNACYTYNSGIYIMGLASLALATDDMNYWNSAYKFATVTVKRSDWVNSNGVLKSGTNCDDGLAFNSQLVRGISYLLQVKRSDPSNVLIPFLNKQMNSILRNDRSGDTYGPQWTGPLSTPRACTQQTVLSGLFGGFFAGITSPLVFQIDNKGSAMAIFADISARTGKLQKYASGSKFQMIPAGFNTYLIQIYNTKQCLSIEGQGFKYLTVKGCSDTDVQTLFVVNPTGDREIYNIVSKSNGQYLDTGCHKDEGTSVYTWARAGVDCQKWSFKQV